MMNYFQLGIPTFALISKTQENLARSVSKRRVIRDFSSYTFVKIRGKVSSDRQRKATRHHINAMNEQRSLGTRTLKSLIEIKTSGRAKTRYPKRKKKRKRRSSEKAKVRKKGCRVAPRFLQNKKRSFCGGAIIR